MKIGGGTSTIRLSVSYTVRASHLKESTNSVGLLSVPSKVGILGQEKEGTKQFILFTLCIGNPSKCVGVISKVARARAQSRVEEIRVFLSREKVGDLVERLQRHLDDMAEHTADYDARDKKVHGYNKRLRTK